MVEQVVMCQIMFVVLLMILHNHQALWSCYIVVGNLFWYLTFVLSPFYILNHLYYEVIYGYGREFIYKPNIYVSLSTSELRVRLVLQN